MCRESKCKGKQPSLPCLATLCSALTYICHFWWWVQCVVCPAGSWVQFLSQQTMAGWVNPQPLVKDPASWWLSCISFPPGDESNKARSVQPSRYLPCNGPPPLCSSLLAPVHTGRSTSLPQAWAAQLSRSLTSLTYLSFISLRLRGQFSVNIGRNSIHFTLCAPIQMSRPAHYNLL